MTTSISDSGVQFADGSVIESAAKLGLRNRIINGDMRIDQRNAGAEVNPAVSGSYYLDRWSAGSGAASKFKIGQNAGAVTPPVGFSKYLGCTSLSAYTPGAGEAFNVQQRIEGFNIADLAWGTASAKTVTLSFWVRSSLTGTFGGALRNSANDRSYPFNYTISSANTWEQKSVVIPGETSGTWVVDSGMGIRLFFDLGSDTAIRGTAGAWASASYSGATGAVNVVGTNAATWYVTGVQLELGSVATPFEHRPYGMELALCQRYYEISNAVYTYYSGVAFTTQFRVTKRSTPTVTVSAGAISGGNYTGTDGFRGSGANVDFTWTASAEL